MKGHRPRITLLGNNSGRNLGDAAILSSILDNVSHALPDCEFYVPTISPGWIEKHYGQHYRVKAVNVMPWTLSIRLLGLPTLVCLAKSDVALICDGIIFGKKLFNPAFNYLITLVFLVPLARLLGCRIVCFNCGIGPFPSSISRLFAKWVLNGSDLITMRERDSEQLAKEVGARQPIEITGDSAFINPVAKRSRALEIMQAEGIKPDVPVLGVNVTKYMDTWLAEDERLKHGQDLLAVIADGVRRATPPGSCQIAVFCTQPMDEPVCRRLAGMLGAAVIANRSYLSHDIQAVMRECALLIGMRFHSLILASAVGVPIVGLIYAPKVRGYMRLLKSEQFGLELAALDAGRLAERVGEAWQQRDALRRQQQEIVDELRRGAERATELVVSRYFPDAAGAAA